MIVRLLIEKYVAERDDKPTHVNQLLDFACLHYLNNKFTLYEYRILFNELMLRGATKPDYYIEKGKCEAIG